MELKCTEIYKLGKLQKFKTLYIVPGIKHYRCWKTAYNCSLWKINNRNSEETREQEEEKWLVLIFCKPFGLHIGGQFMITVGSVHFRHSQTTVVCKNMSNKKFLHRQRTVNKNHFQFNPGRHWSWQSDGIVYVGQLRRKDNRVGIFFRLNRWSPKIFPARTKQRKNISSQCIIKWFYLQQWLLRYSTFLVI